MRRRVLIGLVTGALTLVPLFGTLGYENAFVLSPIFAMLSMAVGFDVTKRARGALPTTLGLLTARIAWELVVLHVIAIGVLVIGRLWQRGCDPAGGLAFYGMGPMIASALGATAGMWAGAVAHKRWKGLLLAFAPMLLCTALGLWRLWSEPVIYAYDPFFGYFSGSVYDESVSVNDRYLQYRFYNGLGLTAALLGFALLVDGKALALHPSVAAVRASRPTAQVIALAAGLAVSVIGSVVIGARAEEHRFTATMESITEELGGTYETEHFIIHYGARSPDDRTIEALAAEHEFAYARLQRIMGRAPPGKVRSFVFPNRDSKRSLMGAGQVQVAAPWRQQIYLDHRSWPHPVLHHELAHVFGNTIGDDLFGVARDGLRLNVGLIEGFATAMAPRASDRLDLHDQVNVLTALQRRPKLSAIMGPGFLSRSSRVAYTTAGSFCLWLIETRGFEGMATLYRTAGDTEQAYGEPLDALEKQWLAFLAGYEGVRPQDVEAQALRFKRRSVFERPCAHKVAEVRREIGRAAGRGRFDEAVEHWEDLCGLEPESPSHKLGLVAGLAEARRFDEARTLLQQITAMKDITVSELSVAHERQADIELFLGDLEAAGAPLDAALALPDSAGRRRLIQLKRFATRDPQLARELVRYFGLFDTKGNALVSAVIRIDAAMKVSTMAEYGALGHYLLGRQLLNSQQAEAAVSHLEHALADTDALPSSHFATAAREALMNACVQTRRFGRAKELLAELKATPDIGNGNRLDYQYWTERIAFFEAYAPFTSPS